MLKKIILFMFSPFAAVCLMVAPDALTLAGRNEALPATIRSVAKGIGGCDPAVESRAWRGDWDAVETIGVRYARSKAETNWERSVSSWNKMLCTFLAPIVGFMVLSIPLALLCFAFDRFRLSRGRMPKYLPGLTARVHGFRRHFNLALTLWMAASYYLYRYWALNG